MKNPAIEIITAHNSKGKEYTLAADFVSHTGGPIGFATYCQREGIPDGKNGAKQRDAAKLDYDKLRAVYETISSIAWTELKKGATTIRRVACRPLIDRKTKEATGIHGVSIGLETDAVADVTQQLETARLAAKAIFTANKLKTVPPVVAKAA